MENEPIKTDEKPIRDERGLFVEGNPGGPGRPTGKTLKEWLRDKLLQMTEEERGVFLKDIPKDLQWRMAEGNPHQTQDNKHSGALIIQISKEGAEKYDINPSTSKNSEG